MKATLIVSLLFVPALWADTVQTVPFLSYLTATNANASALVLVHEVLDGSANLKSGSFEFNFAYNLKAPGNISAIQIRDDRGNLVVSAAITAPSGSGAVGSQVQFGTGGGQPDIASIQDLISNPKRYSVELVTTTGQIRGQLLAAESIVAIGLLSANNETPPIDSKAAAMAGVIGLRAFDSSGNVAVGLVTVVLNYSGFANGSTLTGFNLGSIGGSFTSPASTDPSGSGRTDFAIPVSPADPAFAAEVNSLNGLFFSPNGALVNLRTNAHPGGELSSNLRSTDQVVFQMNLSGSAPSKLTFYITRNADGSVAACLMLFDVNTRFPVATTFTGLDVNQGAAGVAGPIVIASDVDLEPIPSLGNFSLFGPRAVSDPMEVAAINGLLANPSAFYLSLRSLDIPGGSARAQLSSTLLPPTIAGIAAASSPVLNAAPGSIMSIYGSNLSPVTTDLSGFYHLSALPTQLDGLTVAIGGISAPIYYVSPGLINVQVPFDVATGDPELSVTTAAGTSTTHINFINAAPSIFIVDVQNNLGAVVKNDDFSLVTPQNPVKSGEAVVIYSAGLGQTTPPLVTGATVMPPGTGVFNYTVPVTVIIGALDAKVLYSIAAPGFIGLYQTAAVVPVGISGNVSLTASAGAVASNSVNISIQ